MNWKKINLVFIWMAFFALLLIPCNSLAAESYFYVDGGAFQPAGDLSFEPASDSYDYDYDTGINADIGFQQFYTLQGQFALGWEIGGNLKYMEYSEIGVVDHEESFTTYGLEGLALAAYSFRSFKPYVGLGMGYYFWNLDVEFKDWTYDPYTFERQISSDYDKDFSGNDPGYIIKIGARYFIGKTYFIGANYKRTILEIDHDDWDDDVDVSGNSYNIEFGWRF